MPSPQTLLPWLLGGAIGAAGIFQGLHWRSLGNADQVAGLENQLRIAGEENAMLARENESLRSLAQGGGELAVPQEFIDAMEKETGLRFSSSPVLHRAGSEELHDRIAAAVESRFGPSGLDDRQEAYRLIGWLRPEDDLLAGLTAVRSAGLRGWFDETTGEGWVTERFDLKNIPDQAEIVRLLTHILFHQNFPQEADYPGDDAARAREALLAGAAAAAESRFYSQQALASGFLPMTENNAAEQLLATQPGFLQGLANFPALQGKALAETLRVQGEEKFLSALRRPPLTTRAVFYPAEPVAEPQALELPAPPEEPFLTESAGQLGLQLWLDALGDVAAASEIAASWKNDRYILFPDGEESSAVLWDIEVETAAAADQLEASAREIAVAMARPSRQLTISRISPTRIRFINTHDGATAGKLKN